MNDLKSYWKDTLEIIKVSVSSAIFSTWFSKTHISGFVEVGERVSVEIGCPTSFSKNTIEARYFGLVQDSLSKVIGKSCDLTFAVKESTEKTEANNEIVAPLFETKKEDKDFLEILSQSRIKPSFTFENFAVSG